MICVQIICAFGSSFTSTKFAFIELFLLYKYLLVETTVQLKPKVPFKTALFNYLEATRMFEINS